MNLYFKACTLALFCVFALQLHAQGRFAFASDTQSNLYRVDLLRATKLLVGTTGLPFLVGLALSPKEELFGTDALGNLYRVDTMTGVTTLVGDTGLGDIEGLHFYGKTLLGIPLNPIPPVRIVAIDTETAATTPVVAATHDIGGVRAMTVAKGRVLVSADSPTGTAHDLFSIDLKTGKVAFIGVLKIGDGSPPFFALFAMDFDRQGTLYGLDATGGEWIVNPHTADVTFVGNTGSDFWLDMAASSSHRSLQGD